MFDENGFYPTRPTKKSRVFVFTVTVALIALVITAHVWEPNVEAMGSWIYEHVIK